jgi:hypothetical protein
VTQRSRPTDQATDRAELAIRDAIARSHWFATGPAPIRIDRFPTQGDATAQLASVNIHPGCLHNLISLPAHRTTFGNQDGHSVTHRKAAIKRLHLQ